METAGVGFRLRAVCLKEKMKLSEKQLIGVGFARSSEVTDLNHSSIQTWHLRMQQGDEGCVCAALSLFVFRTKYWGVSHVSGKGDTWQGFGGDN